MGVGREIESCDGRVRLLADYRYKLDEKSMSLLDAMLCCFLVHGEHECARGRKLVSLREYGGYCMLLKSRRNVWLLGGRRDCGLGGGA